MYGLDRPVPHILLMLLGISAPRLLTCLDLSRASRVCGLHEEWMRGLDCVPSRNLPVLAGTFSLPRLAGLDSSREP